MRTASGYRESGKVNRNLNIRDGASVSNAAEVRASPDVITDAPRSSVAASVISLATRSRRPHGDRRVTRAALPAFFRAAVRPVAATTVAIATATTASTAIPVR